MFGKLFASTFTGSMVGAGSHVFAVWGYVIANANADGIVELNPHLISAMIGCTVEDVIAAIAFLSSPDPRSRSKKEEGRRLIQESSFLFSVPNYLDYRTMRDSADRRNYMREYMREYRAGKQEEFTEVNGKQNSLHVNMESLPDGKQNGLRVNTESLPVNSCKPPLAQAEEEEDKEEDKEVSSSFVISSSLRSEEIPNEDSPELEANSGTVGRALVSREESVASLPPGDKGKPSASRGTRRDVETVFAAWQRELNHPKAVLDDDRSKPISRALKHHSVEDLCRVPIGVRKSPFHMGQNDRNKPFDYPSVIYKNADQIEAFLALADEATGPVTPEQAEQSVKAQERCGCSDLGGMKKVKQGNKWAYVRCDHAVPIVEESPESSVQAVQWPPPIK